MRNVKSILAGALLLIAGLAVVLIVSNQPGFAGERIKNPDAYLLDIRKMNGADSHTLNLIAGDVLQVTFETLKGSLHMEITAPDGTLLYAGNGEEATAFTITVPKNGAYTVSVEARHAEGTIHIQTGTIHQPNGREGAK